MSLCDETAVGVDEGTGADGNGCRDGVESGTGEEVGGAAGGEAVGCVCVTVQMGEAVLVPRHALLESPTGVLVFGRSER